MKIIGGVLLLLGVLLIERGVIHRPNIVARLTELTDGDQGGWPSPNGREVKA